MAHWHQSVLIMMLCDCDYMATRSDLVYPAACSSAVCFGLIAVYRPGSATLGLQRVATDVVGALAPPPFADLSPRESGTRQSLSFHIQPPEILMCTDVGTLATSRSSLRCAVAKAALPKRLVVDVPACVQRGTKMKKTVASSGNRNRVSSVAGRYCRDVCTRLSASQSAQLKLDRYGIYGSRGRRFFFSRGRRQSAVRLDRTLQQHLGARSQSHR